MRSAWCVALLATAACAPGRDDLQQRRDPGALIVAQPADIVSLDLARVTDSESIEVAQLIYDGLVRWKPGTTDVVPGIATWQVEGKRWTFLLRDNLHFHDGTPLDADAVVFSFERILDSKHPYYIGDTGEYWRNVLKDVERVVAIDRRTVEIDVARPYAPLLGDLAVFPIVSPTAVARWGDDFQTHPVGSGPYAFESRTPGEQVVLHRFDDYWDGPAGLERIVFEVVVDARQRLVDLESGSVDLATSLLPDELPFVELHPDLALHHAAGNDISYLAFNLDRPPFDDVRIRRAANYAINKEPIVKLAFQGRATAADGPLPPSQWAYHRAAVRYDYDVEAAKKLIAEAVADGTLDPTRTFKLYAPTTPRLYMAQPERVARFLQAGLENIGLHTELVLQPFAAHSASVEHGEHDLCLYGWIGDTGDPDDFLYTLFDRDNAQAGAAQNVAFYRDGHVHDLLLAGQGDTNEAARTRVYAEVQDQLARDAPWVPIAHGDLVVAGRADLENVIVNPTGSPVYRLIRRGETP